MLEKIKIEQINTKNGLPNLRVNGYMLHSNYDPSKEAKRFVESNFTLGYTYILFGHGCGYIVDEFIKKIRETDEEIKLIVVEPYLENISNNNEDITLISKSDVDEIISNLINYLNITDKYKVICSPNYDKISTDFYKDFLEKVKNQLYISLTNENTLNAYSMEWQRNYIYNLEYLIHDESLKVLEKKYNLPVVIASGGPSLIKQLPLLKKFRQSVLLISAGSTINTLIKENIEPDFIVSIDGNIANYQHFKDLRFNKATFIYLMSSYPKIRESFNNKGYYFLSKSDKVFERHISKLVDNEIVMLYGGGSVANFALTVANYISSGPICLIGQDLAYTNNHSHAQNNKQFKEVNADEMIKKGAFYEYGYNGDKVLTTYSFLGMKKSFETLLQVIDIDTVYNCTEGGIHLNGFKQIPFKQFLEENCVSKKNINLATEKLDNNNIAKRIKIVLHSELEKYEEIIKILEENVRLINSNQSNFEFANSILKKLDNNDKKFQQLLEDTCISKVTDPINLEVLKKFKPKDNETRGQRYKRVESQNITFYKKFKLAVEITSQQVKDTLGNIEKYSIGD